MSKIGKKKINIVEGVEVTQDNNMIIVTGKKGSLSLSVDPRIQVKIEDNEIVIINESNQKEYKAKHGLYRALIQNMITGVSEGYTKELDLVGVGYRAQQKGKNIEVSLGYSHPISVEAIDGIELKLEGQTKIIVSGISKEKVGQVSATIRKLRPPEPYKGKGVKYSDERIIKKQGKSAKK